MHDPPLKKKNVAPLPPLVANPCLLTVIRGIFAVEGCEVLSVREEIAMVCLPQATGYA